MSTPSLLNIPYRLKAGTLYSQLPETGAGDFTVTRTTTVANQSTRINSLGNIELVADNVPRLDYPLGGAVNGCPALLVEPSAQNQCQRSEEFNNAFHIPFNLNAFGSGSVANTTATRDPYGTNLADYIQENSAAGVTHGIIDIFAGNISGTTYTWSVFAKAAERTIINLFENSGSASNATFNLTTGVATLNTGVSASMQNYGNGWWRCILTYTSTATGNHNVQIRLCNASGNSSYNGTGTQGAYILGAQLETGSVATSYIPTTTAAVTRSADVISDTTATALIGQTEGTLYLEAFIRKATDAIVFSIMDTGITESVYLQSALNGSLTANIRSSGTIITIAILAANWSEGYHKVAIAYGAGTGNSAICIDGGIPVTGTVVNVPACNKVFLGSRPDVPGTLSINDRIRAVAIYPNRIPNTAAPGVLSLATLTAP
jgi:hypothetical protein